MIAPSDVARPRDVRAIEDVLAGAVAKTFRRDPMWAYHVASLSALAEQDERALDWLATAVDQGFINHPLLTKRDPFLEKLRGDPRFERLMGRVKREWEAWPSASAHSAT